MHLFVRIVLIPAVLLCASCSLNAQSNETPKTPQSSAGTQDETDAKELAKRKSFAAIKDRSKNLLIIQSRSQFVNNAQDLVRDLGFGFDGFVESLVEFEQPNMFDEEKPIVAYEDGVVAFPVEDAEKLSQYVLDDSSETADTLARPREVIAQPVKFALQPSDVGYGRLSGEYLLLAEGPEVLEDWDSPPPLLPGLPEASRELIYSSGISLVGPVQDNPFLWGEFAFQTRDVDAEEKLAQEQIMQAAAAAERFLVGVTYEDHSLEIRQQLLFDKDPPVDELFDFTAHPVHLRQALPTKGLVGSIALDLSVVKSQALTRTLLKESFRFPPLKDQVSPTAVASVAEILGDNLNELNTFRAGLYRLPDGGGNGGICVIAVLDPKDKARFIEQLRQWSVAVGAKTDGWDQANDKDELVEQWIAELDSPNFDARRRASRRLKLAGRDVADQLRFAAKNASSPEARMRLQGILEYLEGTSLKHSQQILRGTVLESWFNGSVQYTFAARTAVIGEYAGYELEIQPPEQSEAKTEAERTQLRSAFGDQWNRIRLVPVGDQLVLMVGSDEGLMTATLRNLEKGENPLHDKLSRTQRREGLDQTLEIAFSVPRLLELFDDGEQTPVDAGDELCSFSLKMRRNTWDGGLHVPASQILPILASGRILGF